MPKNQTTFVAAGSVPALPITLKQSGAETTSTTGNATATTEDILTVVVNVTAVSGSPTMTVVIEGSLDGTNWFILGTFGVNGLSLGAVGTAPSNITGVSTVRGVVPTGGCLVRSRSVIGGASPSLTYSVTAG